MPWPAAACPAKLRPQRLLDWLACRLRAVFVVWCIGTQATSQCPTLVRLDGMSERSESIPVDRAVPVHRDTEDPLRLFTLPGMRAYVAARHSEDFAWFLAVT